MMVMKSPLNLLHKRTFVKKLAVDINGPMIIAMDETMIIYVVLDAGIDFDHFIGNK